MKIEGSFKNFWDFYQFTLSTFQLASFKSNLFKISFSDLYIFLMDLLKFFKKQFSNLLLVDSTLLSSRQ